MRTMSCRVCADSQRAAEAPDLDGAERWPTLALRFLPVEGGDTKILQAI
jgi:hypothetical protein